MLLLHLLLFLRIGSVLNLCQGELLLRFIRTLTHFDHTMECSHVFLHDIIQYMKLEIFVALVCHYLVAALSDVIEYHCPLYMAI